MAMSLQIRVPETAGYVPTNLGSRNCRGMARRAPNLTRNFKVESYVEVLS
jgi:hypothetical protein